MTKKRATSLVKVFRIAIALFLLISMIVVLIQMFVSFEAESMMLWIIHPIMYFFVLKALLWDSFLVKLQNHYRILIASLIILINIIVLLIDINNLLNPTGVVTSLNSFNHYLIFELLFFFPCLVVSFLLINLDDKSQLLNNKYIIITYLIASIVGTISGNFVSTPMVQLTLLDIQNTIPNYVLPILLTVIITFILKILFYRTISFSTIQDLTELEKGKTLLQINGLKVYYPLFGGILKRQIGAVKAVDGVNLIIKTSETLGLVGESGCGKSTLARAVLGLLDIEQGEILFEGNNISDNYTNSLRQQIQIVFQDPDASLNPRMKVVDIIAEPLKNLLGITKPIELRRHVLKLLEEVSLKREHLDRYPHEFSGGQKQRIVIARALACNPKLLILDEPTSALDVSVQAQILNLLKDLQKKYGYGFLFITHNLSVVNHIADNIAVMYLGRIVELGTRKQIFSNPTHPYTQALFNSRIRVDPDSQDIKFVISGEVPSPINPPRGCHFNPRCISDVRTEECEIKNPHKIKIEDNHHIWCVNEPEDLKY